MKLAILICTLPERADKLKRLLSILEPQVRKRMGEVFYSLHDAGRSMPTGRKRNQLINQTESEYFVFIDDDDVIPDYYVDEILAAIEYEPDVITFNGYMTTNGGNRCDWTINLGSDYIDKIKGGSEYLEKYGNYDYYRWPNHIVPMRREKVNGVSFPDVWVQEDYLWSKKINELKLLKTEIHIDKKMYWYDKIHTYSNRRLRR